MGEEYTAKDFRTWGGTLTAAVAFAERGLAETETDAKRTIAAVMRTVGERLSRRCRAHRAPPRRAAPAYDEADVV